MAWWNSTKQLRAQYERIREADTIAIVEARQAKQQIVLKAAEVKAELETKRSRATQMMNSWQTPGPANMNYDRVSKEAYGGNEAFYACVEEICTSAAEPILTAYGFDDKPLPDDHPIITLLHNPNPFLNGFDYTAYLLLFRSIAGNAITEIVPDMLERPVELWFLRPDRCKYITGPAGIPVSMRYEFGTDHVDYPLNEIGHYKTRNPLNMYWGMPPVQVLFGRIDTDNFMREFTRAFFFNAGVPATLLAFKEALEDEERALVKSKFRGGFNGPTGWHSTMVTEENEVSIAQLGLPLGQRGIAYPELDEIQEARIAMVMGVPLTLIGARLAQTSSSYANRLSDREQFWNETLVPIYKELEGNFNHWLVPKFPDVKKVLFDLTTIQAFQDETDVLHTRWRNNQEAGLTGWREARRMIGLTNDPEDDDIIFVPSGLRAVKYSEFKNAQPLETPSATPVRGPGGEPRDDAPKRPAGEPMVPGKPNSDAKGNE